MRDIDAADTEKCDFGIEIIEVDQGGWEFLFNREKRRDPAMNVL